jgi:hypothetical protein
MIICRSGISTLIDEEYRLLSDENRCFLCIRIEDGGK